jgi:peptide chain release factor subunit 3
MMFEGQVVILDLLEHKPLVTAGYGCVLHVHTAIVECSMKKLISELDRKTGKNTPKAPRFLKMGSVATVRFTTDETVAVELFKDHAQMGRFTLRDEGVTIAIGKITRIAEAK